MVIVVDPCINVLLRGKLMLIVVVDRDFVVMLQRSSHLIQRISIIIVYTTRDR